MHFDQAWTNLFVILQFVLFIRLGFLEALELLQQEGLVFPFLVSRKERGKREKRHTEDQRTEQQDKCVIQTNGGGKYLNKFTQALFFSTIYLRIFVL